MGGFGANEAHGGGGGWELGARGGLGANQARGGDWRANESHGGGGGVGTHETRSPHTSLCIRMVVHTQGGAHKRKSVATAGVLLIKGPQARRYT